MTSSTTPRPSKTPRRKTEEETRRKDAAEETADEALKREQATKPALMPIGDPAGAA